MNETKIENILKSLNILYIDEDANFIMNLRDALSMKSHNLFIASNLKKAAEIYNDNKINIILIDTSISSEGGIGFIEKLRKLNDDIPIIVLSKFSNEELLLQLIPLKITSFINKPIDLLLLKQSLYLCVNDILKKGLYEITFYNKSIYNVNKKLLISNNEVLELTYHEILFLDALISNKHQVLSGDVYKEMIWSNSYDKSDSALKSLLNRLRSKIGKDSIKTISGYGYRLVV